MGNSRLILMCSWLVMWAGAALVIVLNSRALASTAQLAESTPVVNEGMEINITLGTIVTVMGAAVVSTWMVSRFVSRVSRIEKRLEEMDKAKKKSKRDE